MHTRDALKAGESQQRIFLLNAWRETNIFSEKEKAVLALTVEMTLIANKGVSEEVYNEVSTHFNDEELSTIMMCILAINALNRIAIANKLEIDDLE